MKNLFKEFLPVCVGGFVIGFVIGAIVAIWAFCITVAP